MVILTILNSGNTSIDILALCSIGKIKYFLIFFKKIFIRFENDVVIQTDCDQTGNTMETGSQSDAEDDEDDEDEVEAEATRKRILKIRRMSVMN